MFCFQCQEATRNTGCTKVGTCGKKPQTAALQDLLVYTTKGIGLLAQSQSPEQRAQAGRFVARALFTTITNVSFDDDQLRRLIDEALALRDRLSAGLPARPEHDAARWSEPPERWIDKGTAVGALKETDEDVRSLKELLLYGLKGICAYATHAQVLGHEDRAIWDFLLRALAATLQPQAKEALIALVLETGEHAVTTMALLDRANTSTYGSPEITKVSLGVRNRPGILISGHDLKDLEALLEQSKDSGVDVYTHSEMLPAHYYPAFKKYDHFVGNYGNAWWEQHREFASFNGPIVMTTNCLTPVRDSYKDRLFTTGMVAYPGVEHIPEPLAGESKDFSEVIAMAKECSPPTQLEEGEIVGGFGHAQVLALRDKVIEAVKSGAIKRFVVMAGCDGRQKEREYFSDVAEALPEDTVILTAGCAKYRYNKLQLGDIGGIPRVLDAGQCNDSYSLALIAIALRDAFGLDSINDLPLSFDIAWYEQKAVAVLLALLHLGVKGIRLGPTLPAFLSPGVAKVLVESFDIKPIATAQDDVAAMMQGA